MSLSSCCQSSEPDFIITTNKGETLNIVYDLAFSAIPLLCVCIPLRRLSGICIAYKEIRFASNVSCARRAERRERGYTVRF